MMTITAQYTQEENPQNEQLEAKFASWNLVYSTKNVIAKQKMARLGFIHIYTKKHTHIPVSSSSHFPIVTVKTFKIMGQLQYVGQPIL